MLRQIDRYAFNTRGYLLYTDVLPARQIRLLRQAIDTQHLEPGQSIGEQRFGAQATMFGWHQAFRDLIDHRVVQAVLNEFIGPSVRLDHAYGIMMRPRTSGLGLHGPPSRSTRPSTTSIDRGRSEPACSRFRGVSPTGARATAGSDVFRAATGPRSRSQPAPRPW